MASPCPKGPSPGALTHGYGQCVSGWPCPVGDVRPACRTAAGIILLGLVTSVTGVYVNGK